MSTKKQHKHDKVEWAAAIGEILFFFSRPIVYVFKAIFT